MGLVQEWAALMFVCLWTGHRIPAADADTSESRCERCHFPLERDPATGHWHVGGLFG